MITDKKCPHCTQVKDKSSYGKSASRCKECDKIYQKKYRATNPGLAIRWWHDVNRRAENRSGTHPSYAGIHVNIGRTEFLTWAELAIASFRRAYPWEVPSLDRIDPDGNYEMGNMRVISWIENSRFARRKVAKRVKADKGLTWHPGAPDNRYDLARQYEVSPSTASMQKAGHLNSVPAMNKTSSSGAFGSHLDFPSL